MRLRTALALVCLGSIELAARQDRTPSADVLERIRREALDRSQVVSAFNQFVTVIGPRLAGTPAYKAAADWARDRFEAAGLENAHLEPWELGRGWALDRLTVELIEPRYLPLIGYAEGWSPSMERELVAAPLFIGNRSAVEVAAMREQLAGAIVLSQPLIANFIREDRPQPSASETPVRIGAPPSPQQPGPSATDARQIAQTLRDAKAGVIVRPSAGEHGTVFVTGRDQADARPTVVLAAEHYNMVARMIQAGVPVKLRVNVQTRFLTADTKSYNVVADLPGTDPAVKDEVVMLGAHLDSWHTATGASDNADGAAAVLEAARVLRVTGVKPRRTIRFALWGGEEEGLLGSKAWVQQHLAGDTNQAARERFAVYLNLDPGTGPIYGWYMEDNAPMKQVFDRWLQPLIADGARRNVLAGIGNTDHLSFKAAGVPGYNAIQDYDTYDVRTHHTNVDTYERVREQDLKQNAIVLAWFACNAASLDGRLPK